MSDFDALCQYLADGESAAREAHLDDEPLDGTFLERLEEDMEFHDFEFKQVNTAHDKGCLLHDLMLSPNATAGKAFFPPRRSAESAFQRVADMQKHGYIEEDAPRSSHTLGQMRMGLVLESMGLDPCFAALPKVSHDDSADEDSADAPGSNVAVGHTITLAHPIPTAKPSTPIVAYFMQVVNPTDGILIAQDNFSPLEAYRSENFEEFDLPALRFWSDIAFLQWKSQASEDSELKYVLRYNVTNYTTNFIVEAINAANCCKTMPWPGTEYDADSEEGRALLGTPNGSSTAWMLVQHKQGLGHKTVDKIRVFEHKRELMLLFHIVDVEE